MELRSYLRRIDAQSLRNAVGETILSAIQKIKPADMESQLVAILLLKYGVNILSDKAIRLAIISALKPEEAKALARRVGIDQDSNIKIYTDLDKYYTSYNEEKSKKLGSVLELDEKYLYVRQKDSRSGSEVININYGEKVTLKGYLHDYQREVKDRLTNEILKNESRRVMVQMPTGAGKTYTALESIVDQLRMSPNKTFIYWVVNSNELAEQAYKSFKSIWSLKGDRNLTIYRLYAGLGVESASSDSGVVFASFDTINSIIAKQGHKLRKFWAATLSSTKLVVVDEAHASPAETYSNCLYKFINVDGIKIIGLTATPGRNTSESMQELIDFFENNIIQINSSTTQQDPVSRLQSEGYLAQIKMTALESNVSVGTGGEASVCKQLASNSERNTSILEQIKLAYEQNEPTLIFSCTLDHVYALKILCESENIPTRLIVGNTPSYERDEILESFKNGDLKIIINYDILSTGVDLPNISKIIITRPVGSPILFSQILGRALRGPKNGGNTCNEVITIVDNLNNYESPQMLFQYYWESWGIA